MQATAVGIVGGPRFLPGHRFSAASASASVSVLVDHLGFGTSVSGLPASYFLGSTLPSKALLPPVGRAVRTSTTR